MSLTVGRAKLVQALKDLEMRWEKTRLQWDDAMSEDIAMMVVEPLEPRVRATVTAMEKMAEVLTRARRECGPD
jgi:hypothetical protein